MTPFTSDGNRRRSGFVQVGGHDDSRVVHIENPPLTCGQPQGAPAREEGECPPDVRPEPPGHGDDSIATGYGHRESEGDRKPSHHASCRRQRQELRMRAGMGASEVDLGVQP